MGTHKLYGQVPESDVADLVTDLAAKIPLTQKAAASGVATLDGSTKIPIAQVPTGSSSTTVCIGNDSRLSDSRTPTAHNHAGADINSGTVAYARLPVGTASSTIAAGDDTRLSVKPWAPVNLTDGATPALNAALGTHFRLLAPAGNRTIAVPSNPVDGQVIVIEHQCTTSRTLALNTGTGGFAFGTDITALTATVANRTDFIQAVYNTTANKWWVIGYVKGYA